MIVSSDNEGSNTFLNMCTAPTSLGSDAVILVPGLFYHSPSCWARQPGNQRISFQGSFQWKLIFLQVCRLSPSHLSPKHDSAQQREAESHTETEIKAAAGAPICGTKTATSARQHCWHIAVGREIENVCNKRCKWGVILKQSEVCIVSVGFGLWMWHM